MVSLFEKKGKIREKTAKMLEKDIPSGVCCLLFLVLEVIQSGLRASTKRNSSD
jgi:hypothetical protein